MMLTKVNDDFYVDVEGIIMIEKIVQNSGETCYKITAEHDYHYISYENGRALAGFLDDMAYRNDKTIKELNASLHELDASIKDFIELTAEDKEMAKDSYKSDMKAPKEILKKDIKKAVPAKKIIKGFGVATKKKGK